MRKYFDTIEQIAGNVVSVRAAGVGYDELAHISTSRGDSLAQVIRLEADETLWRVLRHESRPIVIAPPELKSGDSVVLACDESPQADRAMQAFQASGLDFGEEVVVMCSAPSEDKATCEANEAVEFLRSHGIQATASAHTTSTKPGKAILEEVERRNARLLVMGVSKHSTLRDLLLGGVTKIVLRESPVPVFFCD